MKTLLLSLLLISSLFGEAKIYFGANYAYLNESFASGMDYEGSSSALKGKIGYGDIASYGVELSAAYIENKLNVYSAKDNIKYDFNVDLIKAFDFDIFFNPFFKAGFGTGYLQTQSVGKVTYGSFNLGFGVFVPINDYLDFELGYDYKNLSYERPSGEESQSYESNVNGAYAGFNVRF